MNFDETPGWACLHWPRQYGGAGTSPVERVIWCQEEGVYAAFIAPFIIGQVRIGGTRGR
jgi:alkylation response protein AidB-like acyl-CoA dehydrogenase